MEGHTAKMHYVACPKYKSIAGSWKDENWVEVIFPILRVSDVKQKNCQRSPFCLPQGETFSKFAPIILVAVILKQHAPHIFQLNGV